MGSAFSRPPPPRNANATVTATTATTAVMERKPSHSEIPRKRNAPSDTHHHPLKKRTRTSIVDERDGRDEKRKVLRNSKGRKEQGDNLDEENENEPVERDEDIRGRRTVDAPVQEQYLLRTKRDQNGYLLLDTLGKPLYASDFYERNSKIHLVIPNTTSPNNKDDNEKNEGNTDEKPDNEPEWKRRDKSKGTNHEDQKNQLSFHLRKQLRKRQIKFDRTNEKFTLWNDTLFESGELTGAFGIPEKKRIDLRRKLYLAPLTTVGNLPFRRVCKKLGADITCGEMAMAPNLLQGSNSEWALIRRHVDEDIFGVQLAGSKPDVVARAAELIGKHCDVDFIELNAGCPIELVFNRGGGCALMSRKYKLSRLIWTVGHAVDVPVGVKMRTGISATHHLAHSLINDVARAGAQWVTVHGRSRKQRYSKLANWDYIENQCAMAAKQAKIPLLGNGDVYNWQDAARVFDAIDDSKPQSNGGLESIMIARGALIKPWLFTEIKDRKTWDIRSGERLDIYKQFVKFGLEHWGSDNRGVETTRKFLLEWLSFLYRYVPVGIVQGDVNVTMSHRAPFFRGRDDLETLLGSPKASDWLRISEMLLGKAPDGFKFVPRHKSNAWGGDDDPVGELEGDKQ